MCILGWHLVFCFPLLLFAAGIAGAHVEIGKEAKANVFLLSLFLTDTQNDGGMVSIIYLATIMQR